jgi:predicted nucleic acid-binding protein
MASYPHAIVTSVVVLGEIEHGIERLPVGKKRSDLEDKAKEILPAFPVELVTVDVASTYARLRTKLEAHGLNLDDNDLWIVCTAITRGDLLVSRDAVLFRVPGLQIEDWTA